MSKRKRHKRQQAQIASQQRQVAVLVGDWTQRLGLTDWRVIQEVSSEIDCPARAWIAENYDSVHLQFAPLPEPEHSAGWFKPESALEESVVHELVHVLMHDVDLSASASIEQLPRKLQARAVNDYHHHREQFVERLARAFVAVRSGESTVGRICDGEGNV